MPPKGQFGSKESADEGFSLLEVLVIIVVLGILAGIVVFAVQDLPNRTATAACQSDFKTLESAQETYKAQTGTYAISFTSLEGTTMGMTGAMVGPWIKETPNSTRYTIGFDTSTGSTYGDIMVSAGSHAAADGIDNCAYA
jgi:prepilin-type N-terminal cleavage/methylation domain-containing protein